MLWFLGYFVRGHNVIPAGILGDGNPYVNGSIPRFFGPDNIVIGITPYEIGRCHIRSDGRVPQDEEQLWFHNVTYVLSNITFVHDDFLSTVTAEDYVPRPYSPVATLGISSGSVLIRKFESVDFVKDITSHQMNAHFVLNSSLEWFNSTTCFPRSLLSIPYVSSLDRTDLVHLSVTLDPATHSTIPLVYRFSINRYIMSLPEEMLQSLISIIRQHGPLINPSPILSVTFGLCNSVRSHLPEIVLSSSTGTIRLGPEDYTRDIGNGACELLIGRPPTPLSTHFFNPFLLTDINLRFSNSNLMLCDSIATNE